MSLDLDPNYIFRDFVTDGIPASGAHDPKKVEIREWATGMWQAVIALVAGANPGLTLPNLLIRYTITGGTANAIQASPNLTPPVGPGLALFSIAITQENTGPVTINGKPLRTNGGEAIAAGEILPGDILLFLDNGDHFRLLMDTGSLRNKLAAEAAQAAAEAAADRGEIARVGAEAARDEAVTASNHAELAALAAGAPLFTSEPDISTAPSPYLLQVDAGTQVWTHDGTTRTMVGWLGKVSFGSVASMLSFNATLGPQDTIIEAQGFRYRVAAQSATDFHVETAGGAKLYVLGDEQGFGNIRAFGAVGNNIADDTAAIQKALDNFTVVLVPMGTYRTTDTLVMKRVIGSLIGEGNHRSQCTISYRGSGAALLIHEDVVYPYFEGLHIRGNPDVATDYYNTGSIGIDIRAGNTAVSMHRCHLQFFETLVYSNYNSYYNKFFENRFDSARYILRNFAAQNFNFQLNRCQMFNQFLAVNGNEGQVNINTNVFEFFNGPLVASTGIETPSVYFENNYVENLVNGVTHPLPTNFPGYPGAFGGQFNFTGNNYRNLVIRENIFVDHGMRRMVQAGGRIDRLVIRDNQITLFETGNQTELFVNISPEGNALFRHVEIDNTIHRLPGNGGLSATYNQPALNVAQGRDFFYFYDCITDAHRYAARSATVQTVASDGVTGRIEFMRPNGDVRGAYVEGRRSDGSAGVAIGYSTSATPSRLEAGSDGRVRVFGQGFILPRYTTAQRDVLVPETGAMIFNLTTSKINVRGASGWEEVASS